MNYIEFLTANNNLKEFIKSLDKLNHETLNLIKDDVFEFAFKYVEQSVNLMEIALGDEGNWYSWFVFENNFGENKWCVKIHGCEHCIENEKQFYDICIKQKQ